MHESESAAGQPWLTRSEVELELARIALKVMRAAPDAFSDTGTAWTYDDAHAALPGLCAALLGRTSPEHRPFVERRLEELARCLDASGAGTSHAWLNLTFETPASRRPAPPGAG
ncbi:MAG: hypothetical protein ACOY37_02210 [Pseudomonadota bacterium]